jgi:hypothetical protein
MDGAEKGHHTRLPGGTTRSPPHGLPAPFAMRQGPFPPGRLLGATRAGNVGVCLTTFGARTSRSGYRTEAVGAFAALTGPARIFPALGCCNARMIQRRIDGPRA